jgi:hypothetical protein
MMANLLVKVTLDLGHHIGPFGVIPLLSAPLLLLLLLPAKVVLVLLPLEPQQLISFPPQAILLLQAGHRQHVKSLWLRFETVGL